MMFRMLALGAATTLALTAPAHAVRLFAVDEFNTLYSFNSSNPGVNLSTVGITGVGGAGILAMDRRVRDSRTYLLTDDKKIYTLNMVTGVATLFANVSGITGTNFAFDFNPTNANLRIVSNDNTNYVFNFVTNSLAPGANVAYGAGDPNFGADPDVTGAGYVFNDNNPSTGTVLFVLDTRNDVLATQNPASGVLSTVGALGVNLGPRASFDVHTANALNQAFVLNGGKLFSANLTTGSLSMIGSTTGDLFALTAGGVPEPATWGMMILGFGAIGGAMRTARFRASKSSAAAS
jgi:phosphoglycolate phosphatase-like HAD superfamily hydrolase